MSGRRRILFVVPRFHTNLAGAVASLLDAGWDVHVFAATKVKLDDYSRLTPRFFDKDVEPDEVRAALDEFRPDIALVRDSWALSDGAWPWFRETGTPVLFYSLRAEDLTAPGSAKFPDLPCPARVTPNLAWPGGEKDPLANFLPWPVPIGLFPAARRPGPLRIICVAKFQQPRKNQEMLIDAVIGLRRPVDVMLVGSSSSMSEGGDDDRLARFRAAAASAPPGVRIRLYTDVNFSNMPALFSLQDLCVLCARKEPLGMAPLEGMAMGVAPVVSSTAGAARYVRHGETGWHVDPDRPADMVDVLEPLIDDPQSVMPVRQAAHRAACEMLSPEVFLDRIEGLWARREEFILPAPAATPS